MFLSYDDDYNGKMRLMFTKGYFFLSDTGSVIGVKI